MADKSSSNRFKATVSRGTDKKLDDFPRPIVAVDTALLTWDPDRGLVVVEMHRDDIDKWALPGAFVRERETLTQAVERCLRDKLGIERITTRQLCVLDDPDRDERDWVLSVAHMATVPIGRLQSLGSGSAAETRLAPVDRPGDLAWDHNRIVREARDEIRARYLERPDPDGLLGKPRFTLRELRRLHEAVAGEELQRDNFRRSMEDWLEPTDWTDTPGTRGRPAQLFRKKTFSAKRSR